MSEAELTLPALVTIRELLESRYSDRRRPLNWDARFAGVDRVRLDDGREINLQSLGDQSPPESGWRLVLESGDSKEGYAWTLYGLPR